MTAILMISVSVLAYMGLGYALIRHLFRISGREPSVMMSGFDKIAYEDGIDFSKGER